MCGENHEAATEPSCSSSACSVQWSSLFLALERGVSDRLPRASDFAKSNASSTPRHLDTSIPRLRAPQPQPLSHSHSLPAHVAAASPRRGLAVARHHHYAHHRLVRANSWVPFFTRQITAPYTHVAPRYIRTRPSGCARSVTAFCAQPPSQPAPHSGALAWLCHRTIDRPARPTRTTTIPHNKTLP